MKLYPVLTPEAEADLREAFEWYDRQLKGLGYEFLESVEQQFDRILANPRLYQVIEQGIRRALTRRFPYAVYYLWEDSQVVVLAVLQQARHPDSWKRRL